MTNYKEIIFDSITGQITERPYSEIEIIEMEKAQAEAKAFAEKITAKEAARKSALSKLIDLGLTEEEIAAL